MDVCKGLLLLTILGNANLGLQAVLGSTVCLSGECSAYQHTCESLAASQRAGHRTYPTEVIESPPRYPQRTCEHSCMECESLSSVSKPVILEVTYQHANIHQFLLAIKWEHLPPVTNVTGYTILLSVDSSDPLDTCETIKKAAHSPPSKQCAFISGLIPHPLPCDYSSVAEIVITLPRECHSVHPGDCDTCGFYDESRYPSSPKGVTLTGTTVGQEMHLFISWKLSTTYYNPYPNKTYYITISRLPEEVLVAPVLKVVDRENVTVAMLNPFTIYLIQVQLYECGCSLRRGAVFKGLPPASSRASLQPQQESSLSTASQLVSSIPQSGGYSYSPRTQGITQSATLFRSSMPTSSSRAVSTPLFSYSLSSLPTALTALPVVPRPTSVLLHSSIETVVPVGTMYKEDPTETVSYNPSSKDHTLTLTIAVLGATMLPLIFTCCYVLIHLFCKRKKVQGGTVIYKIQNTKPEVIVDDLDSPTGCHVSTKEQSLMAIVRPELPSSDNCKSVCEDDIPSCYSPLCQSQSVLTIKLEDATPEPSPTHNMPEDLQTVKVFIVYSKRSSNQDKEWIEFLACKLNESKILVIMATLEVIRDSLPSWVERSVDKCSTVLCICNQEFTDEWCERQPGSHVSLVNCLFEGSLNLNIDISKYTVVLLREEDSRLIPVYLGSQPRFVFTHPNYANVIDDITQFVANIPQSYIHTNFV